jgi:hypothetical protein
MLEVSRKYFTSKMFLGAAAVRKAEAAFGKPNRPSDTLACGIQNRFSAPAFGGLFLAGMVSRPDRSSFQVVSSLARPVSAA